MFWLLAGAFFVCGASTNGLVQMHLIPMCGDYPHRRRRAPPALLALMGVFDFVGTIASGWLSDRYNARMLLFWYYGLRGLSLLYLPFSGFAPVPLTVFAVFYGLDWIATVPPTVKLTADAFGPQRARSSSAGSSPLTSSAPASPRFTAGVVRTEFGSYHIAFQGAGVLCVWRSARVRWRPAPRIKRRVLQQPEQRADPSRQTQAALYRYGNRCLLRKQPRFRYRRFKKMETGVIFSCEPSSSQLSLMSAQGGGTCR